MPKSDNKLAMNAIMIGILEHLNELGIDAEMFDTKVIVVTEDDGSKYQLSIVEIDQ